MPEKKLRIMREGLAARCEICHQRDCFDPIAGDCTRCRKLAARVKFQKQNRVASHPDDAGVLQVFGALLLLAVHLYFLPNARMLIHDNMMAKVFYGILVGLGGALLVFGKGHPAFFSGLIRWVRSQLLRS